MGVLIALGIVLAILFAFRHCTEFGIDGDGLTDVVVVGVIMGHPVGPGLLCGHGRPFRTTASGICSPSGTGGLAIYGGIIGAVVFGSLGCKWRRLPVLPVLDLTGICFLIGQCIGRWGNFVNQEAFGCNTTLALGDVQRRHRGITSGAAPSPPPPG